MLILILYFTHSVNLYKKKPSTNIWLYLLRFFYIENVKEPSQEEIDNAKKILGIS